MRSATVMPVTSTAGDAGSVERVVICGARWLWRRVRVSVRGAGCAPWPRQQPALEAGWIGKPAPHLGYERRRQN